MPSKHMLPKGKRRQSVRAQYRAARTAAEEQAAQADAPAEQAHQPSPQAIDEAPVSAVASAPPATAKPSAEGAAVSVSGTTRTLLVPPAAAGMRLDAFLAQAIPDISRARAQLLIDSGQVRVDAASVKASHRLVAGETVTVDGEPRPAPLHATPEDIPLEILYEDKYLAVINKPAGMMVHAGAGLSDDARTRGTLVNALLHHMGKLSEAGDPLRPGIVHRLDKETSGAIVVAKDDLTHRKLSEMFAGRRVTKRYLALVHGALAGEQVTVDLPVARDLVRRTRMTTRRGDGRRALSHVRVLERFATAYGPFTLAEVAIETGRTHQIRVHMQSLGHPVVGDALYGAPRSLVRRPAPTRLTGRRRNLPVQTEGEQAPELGRNFLHAAHLEFEHPRTAKPVSIDAPLPDELKTFLSWLREQAEDGRGTAVE